MHVAIIGNGISGITAARHIRKNSDYKITVISSETDYFFSRTALMYIYMGHMKYQATQPYENYFWKKNRIDLLKKYVENIDTKSKKLFFSDGENLSFDKLIIATGSKSNKFGWPGQNLDGVGGLYSFQDLQNIEKHSENLKRAVIVGGGLIGIELAEMFHSRHIPITFLVRENSFWSNVLPIGESTLINREILSNGIDLRLKTELKAILPDKNGKVRAITTMEGEEIECQFVGLTAGVSPNINFIKNSNIETGRGVLVNNFFETNISDVYAIGDCAQFHNAPNGRRPIEQVWYTGRMHGETLAKTICGKKTAYNPGIWFNSAKFIDIEYQTYGIVLSKNPEGQKSLYWENQIGNKCIHIVYEEKKRTIKGFNLFGIRFRHQVCDRWIKEERSIEYILTHLQEASFEPEFSPPYEQDIINIFNQQNPNNIVTLNKKKRFFELLGI